MTCPETPRAAETRAHVVLSRLGLTWRDLDGKSVLDIGAGSCALAWAAAERGIRVLSLDLRPENWTRDGSAPLPTHLGYVRGDALRLPFADASFDLALAHAAPPITHVRTLAEVAQAVSEALRVLRPGGRYLFGPGPLPDAVVYGRPDMETIALRNASPAGRRRMMGRSFIILLGLFPTVRVGVGADDEYPYSRHFTIAKPA